MKPTVLSRASFAVLVCALTMGASSAANLLVNGGFESEPNYSGSAGFVLLTGSQIPGWTIEPGYGVTVHNNSIYPTISGTYSVNMDGEGSGGNNANFYQDFATAAGQQYQLSYDWATWTPTGGVQLEVTVTDTVTSAVLYTASFTTVAGTHHQAAAITGTGNVLRLRVRENPQSGVNDNAFIVDNFAVDTPSAPVPALDAKLLAALAATILAAGLVTTRRRRGARR